MNKEQFLAMSLPYDLKVSVSNKKVVYQVLKYNAGSYTQEYEYKSIIASPILHPISDLTKPIEHKGEKFVPIEILKEMNGGDDIYISEYGVSINNGYAAAYNLNIAFEFVLKLIEWHFDIAGLIEKGEAIDVNTLPENPYK